MLGRRYDNSGASTESSNLGLHTHAVQDKQRVLQNIQFDRFIEADFTV